MRSSFDFKQYDVGSPWGPMDGLPHIEIKDDLPIIKQPDKKFVPKEAPLHIITFAQVFPCAPLWMR